ncbi:uncharacterized protein TNCV_1589971 [Trichonephila clavipes]|uniref:Mutator-like transposase domain-containing protein n=1 Tax=Trichonephila clavipes TaxID=2585209 RepID=A0A8X6REM4_TRICX|nr:uncharacterized protein TNCV_1589971 [Trichonephila clavipes]
MPRASTKVFKKRRGVFNKGKCNKSNDGCGESNSTVPKNSADEKIVLMVQSFVLMKLNHLPATRETCEHSMAEAVREAVDENDGKRDLAVAVDGSWQKRGFSSKNGLVTVTSVYTGKVIDVEVFSKYCICPNKTKHLQSCKRNFEGYSGKMEVAGALSIFQRSQSLYNVRYTKYLGDGDSKAFTSIVENKVYGDHCSVEKLECIGHVMKRMGTHLRRLKTKMRGQKLSDGKPLCGRNRLTEAEIDRLQAYYGLAIRRNLSSVKDMQQAIWAIFLHKLSTDEKPQHGFCPSDSDTWCKFKKAELLGETYHHKNSLPVDVVEAMRPVFRDLANPELLKSVYMEPGDYTVQAMECLDKQRLLRAKYYCLQKTKEVRKEKRLKRKKEDDELLKNADDLEYGGGMF